MRWWTLSFALGLAACGGNGSGAKPPDKGTGGDSSGGGNSNGASGSSTTGANSATGGGPVAPTAPAIAINPPVYTLFIGKTVQLKAAVVNADASDVTWDLVEKTGCGSIDEAGVYTAPEALPEPAVCHARATAVNDKKLTGQARLLIVDEPSGGPAGEWVNIQTAVTIPQTDSGGAQTVLVDPVRPSDFYAFITTNDANTTNVMVSTDFGLNWTDVNTTKDLAGTPWGAAIDPNPQRDPDTKPTLYCPAGFGSQGVFKSTDGGKTWTQLLEGDTPFDDYNPYGRVDAYGITVAPDNPPNHVLFGYHYGFKQGGDTVQTNDGGIGESLDGGKTWTVHVPAKGWGNSHYVMTLDATTWLIIAQQNDKKNGIWKTSTAGRVDGKVDTAAWKQVDTLEHAHGSFQHYIDPLNGWVYVPGVNGIKRSKDKGDTWEWVYETGSYVSSVLATDNFLYQNFRDGPALLRADRADGTNWAKYAEEPEGMKGAPPYGNAASFDGVHWIMVEGGHTSGLWRFVEP